MYNLCFKFKQSALLCSALLGVFWFGLHCECGNMEQKGRNMMINRRGAYSHTHIHMHIVSFGVGMVDRCAMPTDG